jgi:diguanylate cyclase (GGDEF)-like protein
MTVRERAAAAASARSSDGAADVRTAQLVEQVALSHALLDEVAVAIFACDITGRLIVVNRLARELHHMTGDVGDLAAAVGYAAAFDLYEADSATSLAPEQIPLLRALHGEVVQDVEIAIARPGDVRRLVTCTGRQVRAADGSLLGAVLSVREVADRPRVPHQSTPARVAIDPLTGLPNRHSLTQRTTARLASARGRERSTAMLCVDLDGFRTVNDVHGHAVGDQLLQAVARRLSGVLRESDLAARLTGDEFAVLCPGLAASDRAAATGLAARVVDELGRGYEVDGATVRLTASVGVAFAGGDSPRIDTEELLARADAAKATAKQAGKAQYALYKDESTACLRAASLESSRVEDVLRDALDNDRLQVHYQPVTDLASGRIVGAEALARLFDTDGQMLSPATFIPVAERSGLVRRLGTAVLRKATRQAAEWKRALHADAAFGIGVNLSVRQLSDPMLLPSVEQALADSGLAPDALILELTESVFCDSDEHTVMLTALRALGPRLSIDDFGTGYSSLSYLRRFDVDVLKIDRSFISDIVDDARNSRVTNAVIRMALELGVPVVAEGIETEAQLDALRSLGCLLGQGYLLARPMPAEDFGARLDDLLC